MRLYLFRTTPDIPIKDMEKVAEKTSRIFGIDYSIFTEPVLGTVAQTSVEDLLQISDHFLERGEPVVAIAFTREGVDDEIILGQGSPLDRAAWVRWNEKIQQIAITTLHELGHLCEAEHCCNESCIMFHTYREHNGISMNDIFCEKCRITVQNSWVYNRLVQAAEDRAEKGQRLPRIVQSTLPRASPILAKFKRHKLVPSPSTPAPVARVSQASFTPPFPDWSLARGDKEEFVRQVTEHFGYRRR